MNYARATRIQSTKYDTRAYTLGSFFPKQFEINDVTPTTV